MRRRVHDATRAARHVRDGRVHALARFGCGHGGARARRERVRRRLRDGLRAPGRRAAPERAGRRTARGLLGGRRAASRSCSAARASRRRPRRSSAFRELRARARPGHGRPRRLRARRRSAAGCSCCASSARGASRTSSSSRSATRSTATRVVDRITATIELNRELLASWPGSAELYLPAPRRRDAVPQPRARRDVPAHRRREPRRLARGGDRARAARLLRGLRRGGDRPLLARRRTGSSPGDDLAAGSATLEPPSPRSTTAGSRSARRGRGRRARSASSSSRCSQGSTSPSCREAELVHVVTECAKLAFADRDALYGDADGPARHAALARVQRRAAQRSSARTRRPSYEPGLGRLPSARRAERTSGRGRADARRHRAPRRRRPLRQHDLGDAERRLAAELAGDPGARLAARHARADVLARGGSAVLARPGTRPRTTLSPGLALRDGEPYLAWGTPGGDQQEQWALHVFLRHVDLGLNLQEAIDAPEFHTDHLISSFYPARVRAALALARGALRRRGRSPTSSGAATTSTRHAARGRSAASAPSRASPTGC